MFEAREWRRWETRQHRNADRVCEAQGMASTDDENGAGTAVSNAELDDAGFQDRGQ